MSTTDHQSDRPTITQYTDPMCTWCWGSEPIVQRLQTVYGDQLRIRYVMGGLIEDFDEFYDATNDIGSPADVAPHWLEASEQHGMPVDTDIFDVDPALSTYPASIAYVAARQQDQALAGRFLRRLREAFATEVRNVSHREEQVDLAREVGLDIDLFTRAIEDGTARAEFEEDLSRTRSSGVRAFPTYDIMGPEGEQRLTGFQSFDALADALSAVAPSMEQSSPPTLEEFVAERGPVATQEVAEVYEYSHGKARQLLQSLVDDGRLHREARGNGYFWTASDGGDD